MLKGVREYAQEYNSQAHLCICADELFNDSVTDGIYGFPHRGKSRKKSFWRAIASMYNIGPDDLIFIYRRKGSDPGSQEIHGPFKIHTIDREPAIYYDLESSDYPMLIGGTKDCKVRFLFESFGDEVFSIANNYELVKKFEKRDIWGYRHPAVMNIGAARKKSVTSFTNQQVFELLDLMEEYGELRYELSEDIPSQPRINAYNSLADFPNNEEYYKLNDIFLSSVEFYDEAFLYAYVLRGIKTQSSMFRESLIEDFSEINNDMIDDFTGYRFIDLTTNAMMEVVISTHLQEELDVVLTDENDSNLLVLEFKTDPIEWVDIKQTQNYLDLLETIFPQKNIFANVIGSDLRNEDINSESKNRIKLAKYEKREDEYRFVEIGR